MDMDTGMGMGIMKTMDIVPPKRRRAIGFLNYLE
jgi:hypothetical protein